jgi:hypothetical protein
MLNNSREDIESRIRDLYINASSPYSDGYSASDYKKDLVMIQFMLNKLIEKCPNFGKLEDDWEQEILINILKDEV